MGSFEPSLKTVKGGQSTGLVSRLRGAFGSVPLGRKIGSPAWEAGLLPLENHTVWFRDPAMRQLAILLPSHKS